MQAYDNALSYANQRDSLINQIIPSGLLLAKNL